MNTVCEMCGDIGFRKLLVYCRGCKDCAIHLYCFEKIIYDGSSTDWLCSECQERSGEVTCSGSLENASSEKSSHAHSGSTMQQSMIKRVELENFNPLSQKYDTPKNDNIVEETQVTGHLKDSNVSNGGPVKKRRRYVDANDDEDEETNGAEETVNTGGLSNSDASNEGRVKTRRRFINVNDDEDEEVVIDVGYASSAQNDVANYTLNDSVNTNLEPQTAFAKDLPLCFRMASDSDTSDQQYNMCSRPINEPVWSGAFKVNNEVCGKLDAHLSNKACEKVWDLSRTLQPVVEVMKIPRLQAWPKKWASATPTADWIGLFFFPCSSRSNEQSHKLLNEISENDEALKVTIGAAELLIFPSTLLSEQDQLFQREYYLWGVFKRKKDKTDRAVLAGEQDAVACATEESKVQEQHVLYQQDDTRCESAGQETSVVKYIENEIMVEGNSVVQNVALREGNTLPDSKLSYAEPNSSENWSKCSVHSRIDRELHASEEVNQQEHYSSPVLNPSNATKPTTESDHGESHFDSAPSTTKLFAIVNVRTPRAQQLVQEMVSEGALIFSVPEKIEATESYTGSSVGGSGLIHDTSYQNLGGEHPKSFDFISSGHDVADVASAPCLELFPVSQENIGWAPRFRDNKEVDLDLSLGARSGAPSAHL